MGNILSIILIILGFAVAGTGIAVWVNNNTIEVTKHTQYKTHTVYDTNGEILRGTNFPPEFWKTYRITKRDKDDRRE